MHVLDAVFLLVVLVSLQLDLFAFEQICLICCLSHLLEAFTKAFEYFVLQMS